MEISVYINIVLTHGFNKMLGFCNYITLCGVFSLPWENETGCSLYHMGEAGGLIMGHLLMKWLVGTAVFYPLVKRKGADWPIICQVGPQIRVKAESEWWWDPLLWWHSNHLPASHITYTVAGRLYCSKWCTCTFFRVIDTVGARSRGSGGLDVCRPPAITP